MPPDKSFSNPVSSVESIDTRSIDTLVEPHFTDKKQGLPTLPDLKNVEEAVRKATPKWKRSWQNVKEALGFSERSPALQMADGLGAYEVNRKQYEILAADCADSKDPEARDKALGLAAKVFALAKEDYQNVQASLAKWPAGQLLAVPSAAVIAEKKDRNSLGMSVKLTNAIEKAGGTFLAAQTRLDTVLNRTSDFEQANTEKLQSDTTLKFRSELSGIENLTHSEQLNRYGPKGGYKDPDPRERQPQRRAGQESQPQRRPDSPRSPVLSQSPQPSSPNLKPRRGRN